MATKLLKSLAEVTGPADLPGYSPAEHTVGIVHLGVGAFFRAHQAAMTDDALAQSGGNWRIAGVSLRSRKNADTLNAQHGLYTLLEKSGADTVARVIGAVDHVIAADAPATLAMLCNEAIRVVTLTVTEAGYGIDREKRQPDGCNSTVSSDLADPSEPQGVLGLLTAAIARRRTSGACPFTVLSCDNLPANGTLLRDGIIGFARSAYDDDLADWISLNIAFPSCMVDRITPASTDQTYLDATQQTGCVDKAAVETEPFIQWIIEDSFPSGRPQWEAGGALFVADVTPYERMKLTMLNGAHSMLAYTGFLAGKSYVRDVMQDENLALLVQRHFKAASALLQPLPGVDFDRYAAELTERFINPAIAHQTFQISSDGTQKLPQRIFNPATEALTAGHNVRAFAFATAMWMRFCQQRHDDGSSYTLRDPRYEEIITALPENPGSASNLSAAFHALPDLIPETLAQNKQWRQDIEDVLATTLASGCVAAIRQEVSLLDK